MINRKPFTKELKIHNCNETDLKLFLRPKIQHAPYQRFKNQLNDFFCIDEPIEIELMGDFHDDKFSYLTVNTKFKENLSEEE